MHRKSDNQGMTLLELIIAMTISVIVVLMIISFISAAMRVFRKTSDDVNLQMETQTALNQIVNLVMEAKGMEEYDVSPIEKRYKIDQPDTSDYKDYVLIFADSDDEHRLYLVELTSGNDYKTVNYIMEKNLMAEYVDDFNITTVGAGNVQNIYLKLVLGSESYELSKKVTLRNYVATTP